MQSDSIELPGVCYLKSTATWSNQIQWINSIQSNEMNQIKSNQMKWNKLVALGLPPLLPPPICHETARLHDTDTNIKLRRFTSQ